MKYFPDTISPENESLFPEIFKKRLTCYLRRDIFEFLLSRNSEQEFFDLDFFFQKFANGKKLMEELGKKMCLELEQLNWKTKMYYGGTAIFIFKNEPPVNCCG